VPLGVFVKEARRADKLLSQPLRRSATRPDPNPDSARARGDTLFDPLRAVLTQAMTAYLAGLGRAHRPAIRLVQRPGLAAMELAQRHGRARRPCWRRRWLVSDTLERNRAFKVAIAHGMTDLVTPYLTSRYVIDHLPASLTTAESA
jgi:hypothetical protein